MRYLHTEPGAASDVIATWSELLDGRAEVRSRDEAVAAGLFGVVRPTIYPESGMSSRPAAVTRRCWQGPRGTRMGSARRLSRGGHAR